MTLETTTSHEEFRTQLNQAVQGEQNTSSKNLTDTSQSPFSEVLIPTDVMVLLTAIFTAKQAAIFLLNKSPSYGNTPLNLLKTGNEKQIAKVKNQLASIMNGYPA